MGMYTELNVAFELKKDCPKEVIEILRFLSDGGNPEEALTVNKTASVFNHPFFKTGRWDCVLCMSSYYFIPFPVTKFQHEEASQSYFLSTRFNLKNYSGEIEAFIDWITPYLNQKAGDFLGYSRYEEDEHPTLLYHPNKWIDPSSFLNKEMEVI